MAEKLTQEEADIRLAAAGLAMAGIGQSVVQMAHMAARMAKTGMDVSNAGHQFNLKCNDCGYKTTNQALNRLAEFDNELGLDC